jgi:transposase
LPDIATPQDSYQEQLSHKLESLSPTPSDFQAEFSPLIATDLGLVILICSLLQQKMTLTQELGEEKDKNKKLEAELNEVKAKLNENSSNSNWPSGKDKYPSGKKNKSSKKPSEKNQGGQPGRGLHVRKPLDPETTETNIFDIDTTKDCCPSCGGSLVRDPSMDKQYDRIDLPKIELEKIINIVYGYRCSNCGKSHHSAPADVTNAGLIGNILLAFISILKMSYNLSIRKTRNFLNLFLNEDFSIGYLSERILFVAKSLFPIYLEMFDSLKNQPFLNIDETSHRLSGNKVYTWVFAGLDIILYKISTRATDTLVSVLGNAYKGIIGCDCFSSYFSYLKIAKEAKLQLCFAHLRRDFQHCVDFPDEEVHKYGLKNKSLLDELTQVNHQRNDALHDNNLELVTELTDKLLELKQALIESAKKPPSNCKKAQSIAKRFVDFPEYYFRFIDHPGVETSNNYAERSVRPVVIARKITIGTESLGGNLLCQVLWSITETLKLKNINPHEFIVDALNKATLGKPLPSVVNIGEDVDQKYVEKAKQELLDLKEASKKFVKTKKEKKAKKLEEMRNKNGQNENRPQPGPTPSSKNSNVGSNDKTSENRPQPGLTPSSKDSNAGSNDKTSGNRPPPGPAPSSDDKSPPSPNVVEQPQLSSKERADQMAVIKAAILAGCAYERTKRGSNKGS